MSYLEEQFPSLPQREQGEINPSGPKLSESDNKVLEYLGSGYSIKIKNGKKYLFKGEEITMKTGYQEFFVKDGGIWGKIGIDEDPIIAPGKIEKVDKEKIAA